jgi:hypothetical protein
LRTRTTVNNCEIMYRLLSHFPHFSLYIWGWYQNVLLPFFILHYL